MASSNSRMTWRMRMLISKLNRSTGVCAARGKREVGSGWRGWVFALAAAGGAHCALTARIGAARASSLGAVGA
eukprot:62028-Prymnesium_polylepis.1